MNDFENLKENAIPPPDTQVITREELIEEFVDFFSLVKAQNQLIELRFMKMKDSRPYNGYFFNNRESIVQTISLISDDFLSQSMYYTINEIRGDFKPPRPHCLKIAPCTSAIKDSDISKIRFIVVDIDPTKEDPNGQATNEEVENAFVVADKVIEGLAAKGFPEPLAVFSGNGLNLYYSVDMDNTPENKDLRRNFLKTLNNLYGSDKASIDTGVFNAARVFKVAGCMSTKGENTEERPYRKSGIIQTPDVLKVVPIDKIVEIANLVTPKRKSGKNSDELTEGRKSGADKIVEMIQSDFDLALNQDGISFLIERNTNKIIPVDSSPKAIRFLYYKEIGTISNGTITTVIETLDALCEGGNWRIKTANKNYMEDGCIYYQCDEKTCYKISAGGITKEFPQGVYFIQQIGSKEQVIPDLESKPNALPNLMKKIFNVQSENDLSLLTVYVAALFVDSINHPILSISGSQGSAKTTAAQIIKDIFDPNEITAYLANKKIDDLAVVLSGTKLVIFDNLSGISAEISDLFCMAVTGGYQPKRALYTNNEICNLKLNSNIIITGISESVKKSDLIDRTVFV